MRFSSTKQCIAGPLCAVEFRALTALPPIRRLGRSAARATRAQQTNITRQLVGSALALAAAAAAVEAAESEVAAALATCMRRAAARDKILFQNKVSISRTRESYSSTWEKLSHL